MFIEYGELSTLFYETTKPVGTELDGDITAYKEHLGATTGKILEAGVGTGRMLIPLLQAGFDVEGVDISSQMLSQCRKNLKAHQLTAPLYEQDLTQLALPTKYEAIIMPTGSFCLLPRAKALQILRAFKAQLVEGGALIIDSILPQDFTVGEVYQRTLPLDDQSGILFTSTAVEMDWVKQQTVALHRYEKLEQGTLVQTELSRFVLAWYGIEEMTMLLKAVGFTSVSHTINETLVTFYAN